MQHLPEKVGVTANLTINYRAPTRADQVAPSFLLDDRILIDLAFCYSLSFLESTC
jgi:hypothetical protein